MPHTTTTDVTRGPGMPAPAKAQGRILFYVVLVIVGLTATIWATVAGRDTTDDQGMRNTEQVTANPGIPP